MNDSLEKNGADAGELALKAHVFWSNAEIRAEMTNEALIREEIVSAVNLTEAPDEAVCSLILDLLSYCEREQIHWSKDVVARVEQYAQKKQCPGAGRAGV